MSNTTTKVFSKTENLSVELTKLEDRKLVLSQMHKLNKSLWNHNYRLCSVDVEAN